MSVGAECDLGDTGAVVFQGWVQGAWVCGVGEVPQSDGAVVAAGGQGVSVGAERDADHTGAVALQGRA